ncbi:MAG: universal stress protein [Desulfuromonadales bacterium]
MSLDIKNILVAKDLSTESADVIRYALELAGRFDAQVHVLHVMPTVDPAVLNMVAISMGPDKLAKLNQANEKELADKTRKQLEKILEEEKNQLGLTLLHTPKVEVHHGEPVSMILKAADHIDADLIVVGSHSKGRLHYAFLGSVAEKILHKTHRPVIIVPPHPGD